MSSDNGHDGFREDELLLTAEEYAAEKSEGLWVFRVKNAFRHRNYWHRHRHCLLIHILLLSIQVSIFLYTMLSGKVYDRHGVNIAFSPARKAIEYEKVVFNASPQNVNNSMFVGQSRPELDDAWNNLLRHHNLRFYDDEWEKIGESSIPLGDEPGSSFGMFTVFHELHCLKIIRQSRHMDYYYHHFTAHQRETLDDHAEHCINVIRQSLMCHADISMVPYEFQGATRLPSPRFGNQHQCVSWVKLTKFLDSRIIDVFAPGMLTHPVYGPSYPGGRQIEELTPTILRTEEDIAMALARDDAKRLREGTTT